MTCLLCIIASREGLDELVRGERHASRFLTTPKVWVRIPAPPLHLEMKRLESESVKTFET